MSPTKHSLKFVLGVEHVYETFERDYLYNLALGINLEMTNSEKTQSALSPSLRFPGNFPYLLWTLLRR